MIFASTPVTGSPHNRRGRYLAAGVGWGRVHEANPILLQIREDNERAKSRTHGVELSARIEMWLASIGALNTFGGFTSWDSPGNPRHVLTTASDAEVEHARRVLERLAHHSTDLCPACDFDPMAPHNGKGECRTHPRPLACAQCGVPRHLVQHDEGCAVGTDSIVSSCCAACDRFGDDGDANAGGCGLPECGCHHSTVQERAFCHAQHICHHWWEDECSDACDRGEHNHPINACPQPTEREP